MVIQMNNPLYDPQFLAGLAIARGQPADQAYTQAALMQQQNEDNQMKQAEYERQQYFQQALPQILGQIANLPNPSARLQALVENGVPIKDAALILERTGLGGSQESSGFSQVGQENAEPRPILSAGEKRINATMLKDFNQVGRNAERELRLLEDSEEAFQDFDKNTGYFTEAGGLLSKLPLPKGSENVFLSTEGQTAKAKIDKLNSQLFQNRVAALGSKGTDAAKKEILQGLPSIGLTKEARDDLLATKKRENYEAILRARFFNEWAKTHGNDLSGADNVFSDFVGNVSLLDESGRPNKALISQLSEVAKEGMNVGGAGLNTNDDGGYSLEELLAEQARRKQGM